MSDERLVALEELTAHQARTIEELSGEIARQWSAIEAIEKRLKALADRFAALEELSAGQPEDRRPPHW